MLGTLLLALLVAAPLPEEGREPLHAPPLPPFARLEQSLRPERPATGAERPSAALEAAGLTPAHTGFRPEQLFALEPPPAFSGGGLLGVGQPGLQALPPAPGDAPLVGPSLERVMRLYRSSGPRTGLQVTVVPGPPCWP